MLFVPDQGLCVSSRSDPHLQVGEGRDVFCVLAVYRDDVLSGVFVGVLKKGVAVRGVWILVLSRLRPYPGTAVPEIQCSSPPSKPKARTEK